MSKILNSETELLEGLYEVIETNKIVNFKCSDIKSVGLNLK